MEDGVNLDRAFVRPPEEHSPVADPETKRRSSQYALDVANAGSRVLIDAGNDAGSRRRVDPSQVTARPSGEHDARVSQTLLPSPFVDARGGLVAFRPVHICTRDRAPQPGIPAQGSPPASYRQRRPPAVRNRTSRPSVSRMTAPSRPVSSTSAPASR